MKLVTENTTQTQNKRRQYNAIQYNKQISKLQSPKSTLSIAKQQGNTI